MATKISQKIVACSVVTTDKEPPPMSHTNRAPVLTGRTYKIERSPHSDSALYVTINDHDGKPFEVFINSKDMKHFQWTVALTRVISATFRKGGDCTFLIEELKSIRDPNGGYFRKGKFAPSLVYEIGEVLEAHLVSLGLHEIDNLLADAAQAMVKEKLEKKPNKIGEKCDKCGDFSVVLMDNCLTCLSCGASKCG